jgi:hypothetical protein
MQTIASSVRALWPLVALYRSAMAKQAGVRAAQAIGALAALAAAIGIGLTADRFEPDAASSSQLARAALGIVIACGTLTGLSLARSPKDGSVFGGLAALAGARGFSPAEIAFSEVLASLRMAGETIFAPTAALGVVALVLASALHLPGAGRTVFGVAAFGAVAAATIGLLASACRRWGGSRGRSWFALWVVVPWALSTLLPSGWASDYLSIPGLLERAWTLLAKGAL